MYYPPAAWYPMPHGPCVHHHAFGPCGASAPLYLGAAVYYVLIVCAGVSAPCSGAGYRITIPHELAVKAGDPPQESLIGGRCDVHLTLEYLVEAGAANPKVEVNISSDGTSSTWSDEPTDEGYHVKEDFMSVEPGAKVKLTVTDATARLRWCETICC